MEWLFELKDINKIATAFWKKTGTGKVIAFHGEMGAGKTTFIHSLCEVKNVTTVVSSPTFALINEYVYQSGSGEEKIYHIDLYRIRDEQEALLAGIEDCLYSGFTCLVEWPEKAPGILPANTIHAYIEVNGNEVRRIRIADN